MQLVAPPQPGMMPQPAVMPQQHFGAGAPPQLAQAGAGSLGAPLPLCAAAAPSPHASAAASAAAYEPRHGTAALVAACGSPPTDPSRASGAAKVEVGAALRRVSRADHSRPRTRRALSPCARPQHARCHPPRLRRPPRPFAAPHPRLRPLTLARAGRLLFVVGLLRDLRGPLKLSTLLPIVFNWILEMLRLS